MKRESFILAGMYRKILFIVAFSFVVQPVFAQDSMIRVIGEDGSVQEIEITPKRKSSVARVPEVKAPAKPRVRAPVQAPPKPLQVEEELPEIKTEMPERLKAIVTPKEPEASKEIEKIEEAPAEAPVERAVEEVVEEALEESVSDDPAVVEWNQPERVGAVMLRPPYKPATPDWFLVKGEEKPVQASQDVVESSEPDEVVAPVVPVKPSGPITKSQAISIAMEVAPPASNVKAIPKVLEGRPVYIVTFRTEDGPLDVIVDYNSGDILK